MPTKMSFTGESEAGVISNNSNREWEGGPSDSARDSFDLKTLTAEVLLLKGTVQDLLSATTSIRQIQAAVIDLIEVKGVITSEEFVQAHSLVVEYGLQNVTIRKKALSSALQLYDGASGKSNK